MWLYYWLAANGIHPLKDAAVITVPPPQMVAKLCAGDMDGYCAGEPWNALAGAQGIGFTVATSQEIWPDHPEKVLGATAEWTAANPNTARALTAAVLEAGRWIDASPANRRKAAETIAAPAYVNADRELILGRMLGRYEDGLGKSRDDGKPMKFFDDGAVNFPWLSDGMWFLTQHKRWGLLEGDPDYLGVAGAINRLDIYRQAARAAGVPVPEGELRSSTLMDGVVWDGRDPGKYAAGFRIAA